MLAKYLMQNDGLYDERDDMILIHNAPSLSAGFAYGERLARHDLRVFIHHDVSCPRGWRQRLHRQIAALDGLDANWGIAGVAGFQYLWDQDRLIGTQILGHGRDRDHVWKSRNLPAQVDCVDSCVMVRRRGVPLFDAAVPTFHGAAEDLCYAMKQAKRTVWAIDAPIVHHSGIRPSDQVEPEFETCAKFLVKKWKDPVPSATRIWEHTLAHLMGRPVTDILRGLSVVAQ